MMSGITCSRHFISQMTKLLWPARAVSALILPSGCTSSMQFRHQPSAGSLAGALAARWGKEWAEAAQVGILDQENRLVPVGKIGEVCIRGPNVTKGYLNNPSANKEAYAGEH